MSRRIRKRTFGHVRPAKIQISLCIRTVWLESHVGIFWITKDAMFLQADNENSDETSWVRRIIWVCVGRTCQKVHFLTMWLKYLRHTAGDMPIAQTTLLLCTAKHKATVCLSILAVQIDIKMRELRTAKIFLRQLIHRLFCIWFCTSLFKDIF